MNKHQDLSCNFSRCFSPLPFSKRLARLALSHSSVTACSRLMPLLVGSGFHAQMHLAGQYSNFKCLSFNLLPSSIIPFHPTICVIFFCLKSLYCCSLLHSMTNYPSSYIFSAQKCAATQSHGIITCCALYFLTVHSSVSRYFPASFLSSHRLTILSAINFGNN